MHCERVAAARPRQKVTNFGTTGIQYGSACELCNIVSHGYTNSQRLYTMVQADRGDASTVGVPVGQDPDLELGQGDIDLGE